MLKSRFFVLASNTFLRMCDATNCCRIFTPGSLFRLDSFFGSDSIFCGDVSLRTSSISPGKIQAKRSNGKNDQKRLETNEKILRSVILLVNLSFRNGSQNLCLSESSSTIGTTLAAQNNVSVFPAAQRTIATKYLKISS